MNATLPKQKVSPRDLMTVGFVTLLALLIIGRLALQWLVPDVYGSESFGFDFESAAGVSLGTMASGVALYFVAQNL